MVPVRFWFRIATKVGIAALSLGAFLASQAFAGVGEEVGDAAAELTAKLHAVDQIRADFDQTVSDPYGQVVEVSSGQLLLAKPNARWQTTSPYPQTLIIRGQFLQVYDPDLEQVTQRDISEGWEQVPLALLTGDVSDITQHFTIARDASEQALDVFVLTPLSADAMFVSVKLRLREGALNRITIRDHGSQETVVNLSNYEAGVVVDSRAFSLELPPGTDVIDG